MRLLLVEDDNKLGAFIRKGLQEAGVAVDYCTDGEEALTMAMANEYDVAIIDRQAR
jgi:DNA-binding response OmpR family regulator